MHPVARASIKHHNTCGGVLVFDSQVKLIYDQESVGQSVLVSGAHLEPATNFSFSIKFPSDSCGLVIL
jgi:hypothetical protein